MSVLVNFAFDSLEVTTQSSIRVVVVVSDPIPDTGVGALLYSREVIFCQGEKFLRKKEMSLPHFTCPR